MPRRRSPRYHDILHPVLGWVTRPELDQRLEQARRDGVRGNGFVAPVGKREHYDGLFSGKKHVSRQNVSGLVFPDRKNGPEMVFRWSGDTLLQKPNPWAEDTSHEVSGSRQSS